MRSGAGVLRRPAARGDGLMSSEVRGRLTARRAWLVALAGGALAVGSAGAALAPVSPRVIDAGTNAQQAAEALNRAVRTWISATGSTKSRHERLGTAEDSRGHALQLQRIGRGGDGDRRHRHARRVDQPERVDSAADLCRIKRSCTRIGRIQGLQQPDGGFLDGVSVSPARCPSLPGSWAGPRRR